MAQVHRGSERIRAGTMTAIARNPGQHREADIAELLGVTGRTDVNRAIRAFVGYGWVVRERVTLVEGESVKSSYYLGPSQAFWDDYVDIVDRVTSGLPVVDLRLYNEAIDYRAIMDGTDPESLRHRQAHASYLGRAVLLGEQHDLARATQCNWFGGQEGWKALIGIEALKAVTTATQS